MVDFALANVCNIDAFIYNAGSELNKAFKKTGDHYYGYFIKMVDMAKKGLLNITEQDFISLILMAINDFKNGERDVVFSNAYAYSIFMNGYGSDSYDNIMQYHANSVVKREELDKWI